MDNSKKKDRSITATGIVIAVIYILLISTYISITAALSNRSIRRMEEGVNTVIEEVTSKLARDSKMLNATAETLSHTSELLSETGEFDTDSALAVMKANSALFSTMRVRVLLPDDRILTPEGTVNDAADIDELSFETEAAYGEHVSNRVTSLSTGEPVLRHFVPIVRNGKTVALLYGVTELKTLPQNLNINNIYNASASVYIIDTKSGDFLLDTCHESLGNIADFSGGDPDRKTKGKKSWDEYAKDIIALNTGYGVFRTSNTDGWEYMYYSPAGINQWMIAVSVPEKEAFTSVNVVKKIYLYLGILMSVTILLYYLWVRRNSRDLTRQAVDRAVLAEKLRKAEAADKAKSTFLSNMSHDIRTPMNAIIGYTTLVQSAIGDNERAQEYLNKILSSSNHMLSLINDILDMSRIESGKLNIEEKECSISDIFKDLRNIVQTQMQSKQLSFFMDTVDIIDEEIYCDKLHVNQVLLNLLSNAIKFTPAGGTVALTIHQKPGAPDGFGLYEIRVKDTGIGMSREFIDHIFEPFERERNTTASGIQGTGLGMAITKNIVDALGGTIEVRSEQGKGSEFIINFKFRLGGKPQKIERIHDISGLRVLIADDNFVTCDSVAKMLSRMGMRPEWVMHGNDAVLHAKQAHELGNDYRAYIIDWLMPDLSGLEVVRRIRAIVGADVPIIVVTAYDRTDFEDEAREAGVTAFCNKPIFLSELRDVIVSSILNRMPEPERNARGGTNADFKGVRLLLVEDNELNREIAEELLTEKGFTVDNAEDGKIAVEKVANSKPGDYSLILMDIQMPNMNGYDAARAIRALDDPKLAGIPIIAMTANAFEEDRKRALESGMNAHAAKPIDIESLVEIIADIVEKNK